MWEKIESLCKKNKTSISQLSKETGIPYSCLFDYKSGRSKPKADKLKKIAAYFKVPIETLM